MDQYDEACITCFLENQLQLFPEKVAETPEEAEGFLEDCMAVICKNTKEVKALDAIELETPFDNPVFPILNAIAKYSLKNIEIDK